MSKSKKPKKLGAKPKKAKKSNKARTAGQLLTGTMLAGGVELVSQEVWADVCHSDLDCGPSPWTCNMGANECDNFCSYP